MEPLQPLPVEKWTLLRETTKENWPTYAYYYNWITNAIKWKNRDPLFKINIYCPDGKHDTGVFVGIFSAATHMNAVFSLKKSKELLRKVLLETNVIDWNQSFFLFSAAHEDFSDVLLEALSEKNFSQLHVDVTYNYFKPKEECVKLEYQVPDECRLGRVDSSHVELVHSVWPHRLEENPELSMNQLRAYITSNKSAGLFLKEDDSLVAWVLMTEWGGLGMLQTVEEHKRKGYGKIVTQALVKEVAEEEDLDSVLFVIEKNLPPIKLFESLGYVRLAKNTWVLVKN